MNKFVFVAVSFAAILQAQTFKPLSSETALMKEIHVGKGDTNILEGWMWPASRAVQTVRQPALGAEDKKSVLEWTKNFLREPFLLPNLDKNLVGIRTAKSDYVCSSYTVPNKYAIQVKDMLVSQAIAIRPESGESLDANSDDQEIIRYVWEHGKQVLNLRTASASEYDHVVRRFQQGSQSLFVVYFDRKGQDVDHFKRHWSDSFYVTSDMRTTVFVLRKQTGNEGPPRAATSGNGKATGRRWLSNKP